ncbi:MAG: chalcone isomerase family protein [Marinicella sp.]|nr:chalcone isomerase family protein [Xanthomonadales bacterium]
MKILYFLLLLLINPAYAQHNDAKQWVKLGEAEIAWGYKTPYRINLMAPRGIHDVNDIKNGVQVVQFDLEWLAPVTSKNQVEQHFRELIEAQLDNPESIKFNQTSINRLLKKLPEANRFDRWQFIYSPDAGTQIIIAGEKVHLLIGSEINRAIHHAWLLRDPVTTSKLLTRLLKIR